MESGIGGRLSVFKEKQYGKYPYEPTEHSSLFFFVEILQIYFVWQQALAVCVHYGFGPCFLLMVLKYNYLQILEP